MEIKSSLGPCIGAVLLGVFVTLQGSSPTLAEKVVDLPYRDEATLKAECKKSGGKFEVVLDAYSCTKKGAVHCSAGKKKCIGLTEDTAKPRPKKRPKVLQQGNSSGGSGNSNPTVLSGNPRKTPTGNMPGISGDGGIQ